MESRHRDFSLELASCTIKISSNFDSGNLESAQLIDGKVTLTPAFDPMNAQYSLKQSSKTFFHFSIQASSEISLPIVIRHMKILQYFGNDQQFQEYYRICVGQKQKKGWNQMVQYKKQQLQGMRRVQVDGQYELHFNIKVEQQIYLAYHFPYPYDKNLQYLRELKDRVTTINIENQQKIYQRNQLLVQSVQGRAVNLLTITNSNLITEEQESRVTKSIFPYYQMEKRPKKFAKPYVLFTGRVHSGETSASYALQGFIDFLISNDKRAQQLRDNFVFLIIPLLNPDGVFHGTYRMDTLGHNLNRFYNSAQSHKQPAVFAIQALGNCYSNRIIFFMDLHSHPHPNKGSFIYGNCLTQIQDHTENQLYAKILSSESQCFGYQWCNFSNNQMNSRDINELLTKDGSARVQIYKILNIPFAYTMEMGYHGCLPKIRSEEQISFKEYRRTQKVFTINDYRCHGKSIALSLLTLFQINTANGIKTQAGKYWQSVREQIFKELIEKEDRFRQIDSFAYKKLKMIQQLVCQRIYQPIFKKYSHLQTDLVKKILDKKKQINTITHNSSVKKDKSLKKKELSLNNRQISKTIQTTTTRQKGMISFLPSFQSREHQDQRFQLIDSRQDNYAFAKMLNLDFNPFPSSQKKRIYNVVGNRRGNIKKSIISELQYQNKNTPRAESFDIDSIDVNSQIQLAEKAYKNNIKYEIVSTNRNKVLSNFNQNTYIQNQEQDNQYNDFNWQSNNARERDEFRFVLPKIAPNNDKTLTNFNIQVQFQMQYDKKYKIREHKDLTPAHHKVSLRNNGLRMRSLIKSIK